jgi:hypothetical protein
MTFKMPTLAKPKSPNPLYLLLAMLYLKKYPTKHALAAFLDGNENTGLAWAKRYIKLIQAFKEKKVSHIIHLA